jgi:hypothetical protein
MKTDDMELWQAAEQARKAGMRSASDHNGSEWERYARRLIIGLLRDHPFFHTDDPWHHGLEAPPEKRGLGPVIDRLQRDGWIEKIPVPGVPGAFAAKASARSNGQVKLVWKSCAPEWGGQPKTDA